MAQILSIMKRKLRCLQQIQKILLMVTIAITVIHTSAYSQERTIKGTVTGNSDGLAIPGVNIIVKGSTVGTVTDIDGKFTLTVKEADVLLVSFIGFQTQEIAVGNQSDINIVLIEDIADLDEVVVIGYGVQKKKLNTGATVNVKGEDITKLNTNSPIDALKGISAGVSITQNNGVPGAGTKVIIRGAGTISNPNPLYIVDGVAVGDINFLSPSDIESIDVLKDAASAAIYGSRAANGVILVTTKKGSKKMKPTITYDFYHGWSSIYKDPDLLNAQQYMEIVDEAYVNDERDPVDWGSDRYDIPFYEEIMAGTYTGTDWAKEFQNDDAHTTSHTVNVTGGTKSAVYSLGFSSYEEEGILGITKSSTYKRQNVRVNTEYILIEHNGRDLLKIGENLNYSHTKNPSIRTGNIYWNDFRNILVTSPLLPFAAQDETDPAYPFHYSTGWEASETNPMAYMTLRNNDNTNHNIVGNAYAELEPIANLSIRSAYGINAWFGASRSYMPSYELGPRTISPNDQVDQSAWLGFSYTLTNTIAYNYNLMAEHNFSAVLGQEIQKNQMDLNIEGHNELSTFEDWDHAYLDNVPLIDPTYTTLGGMDEYGWAMESYFGRISYDWKESLLATFVMRADGSSRFPAKNRWGYFPSASVGYILSNLSALQSVPGLNYLKVRGSWGQNGNENIESFQHLSTITRATDDETAHYFFGNDKTIRSIGAWAARVPNPDIQWETSEQTSIGFDANFLNSKLQINFDLYNKVTKDWLVLAPQLSSHGTEPSFINGGDVQNKGFELATRWNDQIGEFKYGASVSLSYNKNEVLAINNGDGEIFGEESVLSQGMSPLAKVEEGYPIGYFWGFETDGIIQNETEAAAWVRPAGSVDDEGNDASGQPYFNNQLPGDVKFVDQNQDGVIDDDDKVMMGDPNPDFVYGFQLNAEYKGFYAQVAANGAAGHQVARSYRGFNGTITQNYTMDIYDRWHGAGTSNTWPRLTSSPHRNTTYVSDIYIHDANYLKISNITIGYDINRLLTESPLQECRVYVTAKNIHTFTKYIGMDPEVGYSSQDWGSGVDLGLYPASKTFMVGVSAKF